MRTMDGYHEDAVAAPADPLLATARLADRPAPHPRVVYESAGEWSFAEGALAEVTVDRHAVRMRSGSHERRLQWQGDPFPSVAALLAEVPVPGWRAYGWAKFELAYLTSGMPGALRPSRHDDDVLMHLVVPTSEVRIGNRRAAVRSLWPEQLARLVEQVTRPTTDPPDAACPVDVARVDGERFRAAVEAAVDEIRRRELQKVILSRAVPVEQPVDLVRTYVLGRRGNSPSRSFLLDLGGVRAAGFSPETLLEAHPDGRVATQPLAGTRALTGDPQRDAVLRAQLQDDDKEVFEHAISVRLACEELARVCEPGSLAIEEFMAVRERGSVQHLASRVAGRLEGAGRPWPAFGALFPAVTVTGVPKAAAYRSIRRHEWAARGLYSGAVLAVDADGSMDAALAIRTIFQQGGRTWLQAGAGVVEQSTPEREYEETCEKLASVARYLVPPPTRPEVYAYKRQPASGVCRHPQ